jgi:hypothetical protein
MQLNSRGTRKASPEFQRSLGGPDYRAVAAHRSAIRTCNAITRREPTFRIIANLKQEHAWYCRETKT